MNKATGLNAPKAIATTAKLINTTRERLPEGHVQLRESGAIIPFNKPLPSVVSGITTSEV